MDNRVPRDDRMRLAAPRMQRLSAEQEHEATRLLAALLLDAAEHHGVKPRRSAVPTGAPSVRRSGLRSATSSDLLDRPNDDNEQEKPRP